MEWNIKRIEETETNPIILLKYTLRWLVAGDKSYALRRSRTQA